MCKLLLLYKILLFTIVGFKKNELIIGGFGFLVLTFTRYCYDNNCADSKEVK